MLTNENVVKLVELLEKLKIKNINWSSFCGYSSTYILALNTKFDLNKHGIRKLGRYINTYDEMIRKGSLKESTSPEYDAMVEDVLANLKEKCGVRSELMNKLFKVLEQNTEDLPKPDESNSDDVEPVPPCPPVMKVGKGM